MANPVFTESKVQFYIGKFFNKYVVRLLDFAKGVFLFLRFAFPKAQIAGTKETLPGTFKCSRPQYYWFLISTMLMKGGCVVYYTEEEAKRELLLRRENRELKKRVEDVLGYLPDGFPCEPFAGVLVSVASATLYEVHFKERAEGMGLRTLWLEYLDDVLIPENPDKKPLWNIILFHGYGRKGGPKLERFNLLGDPHEQRGKPIRGLITPRGDLVRLHRQFRYEIFSPEIANSTIDMSSWLKYHGGNAERYYAAVLTLFVWHGILFEDLHALRGGVALEYFRRNVVEPALKRAKEVLGVPPIVVRFPWEHCLDWYPGVLKKYLA